MNRGHLHAATVEAMQRSRGRGFEICAHIMLGLPGESHTDMLDSAREVGRLGFDAVKIHNLYAVKNTPMAADVEAGRITLMERDEYVRVLIDFLEQLPPECVVERITGEAPPDYFLGPQWCLDKPAARAAIFAELERRDTWQGRLHGK
jgi:radical SAM protein (TIGR01212 family)